MHGVIDENFIAVKCALKLSLGMNPWKMRIVYFDKKTEAFTRVLQRCNPKTMTWNRNFPSRVQTAVNLCTLGFVDSKISRLNVVRAKLPLSSSVILHQHDFLRILLLFYIYMNKINTNKTKLKKSLRFKMQRKASRKRKYQLYAEKYYNSGISYPS